MKERPILMSAPMVRAVLGGRKSQTRRATGRDLAYINNNPMGWTTYPPSDENECWTFYADGYYHQVRSPYGKPGDRLWVRERHAFLDVTKSALSKFPLGPQNNNALGPDVWNLCVEYSDGSENDNVSVEGVKPKQTRERGEIKWRPGMFMPRWASRITLEVTGVRVERVQEITCADAIAEGIRPAANSATIDCDTPDPRHEYRDLWDSLNAARGHGWQTNPWVWVLEFRRCEK